MGQADRSALEELTRFNEAIDEALADSVSLYTDIAERAKNLFLAVLGHDLRIPLSAVLGAANVLLRSEESNDRTVKTAALILRSSTRMGEMFADLIDFTRTRLGGAVPIVRAPMDLGVAIHEVIEEVGIAHPQCTLRSTTNGDLRGSWDEARMKQFSVVPTKGSKIRARSCSAMTCRHELHRAATQELPIAVFSRCKGAGSTSSAPDLHTSQASRPRHRFGRPATDQRCVPREEDQGCFPVERSRAWPGVAADGSIE